MFSSSIYNYINVLDKAADASWLRTETISNNLSNVDTPYYKRKDVDFQSVLKRELGNMKYVTLDDKIDHASLEHLDVSPYVDAVSFSYREDHNNVDVDTENVELASERLRYSALTDSMTQEFSRIRSVIK